MGRQGDQQAEVICFTQRGRCESVIVLKTKRHSAEEAGWDGTGDFPRFKKRTSSKPGNSGLFLEASQKFLRAWAKGASNALEESDCMNVIFETNAGAKIFSSSQVSKRIMIKT